LPYSFNVDDAPPPDEPKLFFLLAGYSPHDACVLVVKLCIAARFAKNGSFSAILS